MMRKTFATRAKMRERRFSTFQFRRQSSDRRLRIHGKRFGIEHLAPKSQRSPQIAAVVRQSGRHAQPSRSGDPFLGVLQERLRTLEFSMPSESVSRIEQQIAVLRTETERR